MFFCELTISGVDFGIFTQDHGSGRSSPKTIVEVEIGKNQHVVKRPDGWAVRGEGNSRDTSHHRTQEEARQHAREIAINQRSEVVIHDRQGLIRDKDSYGNDPNPPKG